MKEIPFDKKTSVYESGLSEPINFGVATDDVARRSNGGKMDPNEVFASYDRFHGTTWDKFIVAWTMLKTWTSHWRTYDDYAAVNAAAFFKARMSDRAWRIWKACYGPWIGPDWTRCSLHHVGQFFRKNLMSGHVYAHVNRQGKSWTHRSGSGWLVLTGPSSECWIDRWVTYLHKKYNVTFHFGTKLTCFQFDVRNRRIVSAQLNDARHMDGSITEVVADIYVLATTPFAARDVLRRTPSLALCEPELCKFEPLTRGPFLPHTQISFRFPFSEKILWTLPRTALVIAPSEFNITMCAEEQVWTSSAAASFVSASDLLGRGVKSLWTATACACNVPGRIFGKPAIECTREEFIEEVVAQVLDCKALDVLVRSANAGRGIRSFKMLPVEVWHEWGFPSHDEKSGTVNARQPKWVTTTETEPHLPNQQLRNISNLCVAGGHTRTDADLWSIEAAVESGRRAAAVYHPTRVIVHRQYKHPVLKVISAFDDVLYVSRFPHILDSLCLLLVILVLVALWRVLCS